MEVKKENIFIIEQALNQKGMVITGNPLWNPQSPPNRKISPCYRAKQTQPII